MVESGIEGVRLSDCDTCCDEVGVSATEADDNAGAVSLYKDCTLWADGAYGVDFDRIPSEGTLSFAAPSFVSD